MKRTPLQETILRLCRRKQGLSCLDRRLRDHHWRRAVERLKILGLIEYDGVGMAYFAAEIINDRQRQREWWHPQPSQHPRATAAMQGNFAP